MWKPCALSICTAEISLQQTELSSSPTAPYAQDTWLIYLPLKGSKPQAPSSLPPLQPLRQRAVRGWFGGLKDVICSPKRGWSSLWVEPSGGVFSSILPTPVWLPVPVWHHLFLQGTGNIYLSGIIHSGCTIPKKIADFCFTGFFLGSNMPRTTYIALNIHF